MPDKLVIEVYHDAATQKPQVTIGTVSGDGKSDLHRLAGPAFTGQSRNLISKPLDERDAAEIRRYLDAVFPVPAAPVTVTKGDTIRIIPDRGPERVMAVSHVEHHIITLADVPEAAFSRETGDAS